MNTELGEKIVSEISRFSNKKCAVCDTVGNTVSKSEDFSIEHNPLDIKSKKAIPLFFEKKKLGYLYLDEPQNTISEFGGVLKSMAELIIQQSYFAELLTSDEKRLDQIMYDFLNTDTLRKEDFKRVLGSFGVNLNVSRLAIYLELNDPDYLFLYDKEVMEGERERKVARVKRSLQLVFESFYTHHKDNIISYLGSGHFLILKDLSDNPEEYQEEFKKTLNSLYFNIKEELRTEITVGVGGYASHTIGIKESFEESKTALAFGKQIWGTGKIYHFDSFGVVAPLFSGVNEKNINISKNLIKKLAEHEDLLISLKEYFRNDLSLSETAKKMKIHRNTLVYRLDRVAELTEFDPRSFNDAFQLQMAFLMEKYNE